MTYQPKGNLPYKCDSCNQEVIFATKTSDDKGDICCTCRIHAFEACGYNNPTLKQTIGAQKHKQAPRLQTNIRLRDEYVNQMVVERWIAGKELKEEEITLTTK